METSENSKKNRTSREQEKGKTMKIPQVFMDVSLKYYLNGDSYWIQIKQIKVLKSEIRNTAKNK